MSHESDLRELLSKMSGKDVSALDANADLVREHSLANEHRQSRAGDAGLLDDPWAALAAVQQEERKHKRDAPAARKHGSSLRHRASSGPYETISCRIALCLSRTQRAQWWSVLR